MESSFLAAIPQQTVLYKPLHYLPKKSGKAEKRRHNITSFTIVLSNNFCSDKNLSLKGVELAKSPLCVHTGRVVSLR